MDAMEVLKEIERFDPDFPGMFQHVRVPVIMFNGATDIDVWFRLDEGDGWSLELYLDKMTGRIMYRAMNDGANGAKYDHGGDFLPNHQPRVRDLFDRVMSQQPEP
jgi:hypothetical protein